MNIFKSQKISKPKNEDLAFHHLGIACYNIEDGLNFIKAHHQIHSISDIIYDELQEANLCLAETNNGINLELVSGKPVANLLQQGIAFYHVCYEVLDIEKTMQHYIKTGAILISPLKPAILFNNRLVTFLNTKIGLIELLQK